MNDGVESAADEDEEEEGEEREDKKVLRSGDVRIVTGSSENIVENVI